MFSSCNELKSLFLFNFIFSSKFMSYMLKFLPPFSQFILIEIAFTNMCLNEIKLHKNIPANIWQLTIDFEKLVKPLGEKLL